MTDTPKVPPDPKPDQPPKADAKLQNPVNQTQQLGIPPQALIQLLAQANRRPGIAALNMLPIVQSQQQMLQWQAPFPPPEAVERYEKVLPGSFDRLIKMAEQLQAAQIEDNKTVIKYTRRDQQRANYLGAATTAAAMIGAIVCLYMGNALLGGCFLSVPVMAVARALIESARTRSTEDGTAVPVETQQPPTVPGQGK